MDVNLKTVLEAARQLPLDQQKELARRLLATEAEGVAQAQTDDLPITPRFIGRTHPRDRSAEYEWLSRHRDEYAGQWVALDGDRLIGHGTEFEEVSQAMDRAGVPDALVILVEGSEALPFAGV